jgi:ribosome biogenesis GTPase A
MQEASTNTTDNGATGDAADSPALRSYTRKKHAVAGLVQQFAEVLRCAGDKSHAAAAHELLVKLAEDRFTLAVVGQFKRGKSSLINAIIGREVLPTGVLPLTSAITILRYGTRARLRIHRSGWSFADEAPLAALPEFVTQEGNPSNRKQIEAVYVELPVRFLRRGLEFVDTPGIGSAIEANTVTTCNFVPRCDAVLFVTSVDAPLTTVETEFLRTVRQHVRKIFFVLNKIDLLDERELGEVADYARRSLEELTATENLKLYAVSARRALQVARENTATGLPELQEALALFLANETATTFLSSIVDKTRRLCADACGGADAATASRLATLDQRLAKLSGFSASGDDAPAQSVETAGESAETAPVEPAAPIVGDVDLTAALQTRGCPVCNHVEQVAFEFFRHFQYRLATQERAQHRFAEHHGFCPLHAWQLASLMSPQSLSAGLAPLAERASAEIGVQATTPRAASGALHLWFVDADRCHVCALLRNAAQDLTGRLAGFVSEEPGRRAYASSQGVCLRHLARLLNAVPEDSLRAFLLNAAARWFGELAEDLRAYALKREALRSTLTTGDEDDAYRRALIHLVGDTRVCLP